MNLVLRLIFTVLLLSQLLEKPEEPDGSNTGEEQKRISLSPDCGSLGMFFHLEHDSSKPERLLLSPYDGPDTIYCAGIPFQVAGIFLEPFGSRSWKASSEESVGLPK